MRLHLLARTSAIAAATALLAQPALAQSHAGQTFLQVFNVGGPGTTLGSQTGVDGSIGCGDGPPNDVESPTSLSSSNGDIFTFCGNMTTDPQWGDDQAASPDGPLQRMLEGLAPDELAMQIDQAASLASLQINNVSQRITQIHLARRGLEDLGGYAFERGRRTQPVLGAADAMNLNGPQANAKDGARAFTAALQRGFSSGDGFLGIEGVGAFLNADYTRLDASNSSHEVGSEGNGGGFTLGIDKTFGKSAYLGLSFGYSYLATDYNHHFGDSELNDIAFSTYGSTFFGEHFYVDGILTGSILLFDQTRSVPTGLGGSFDNIKSDPNGWNITGDIGFGGEFSVKPFDLNPYLRGAVSYTEVDSYDEHGSSLALDIKDQDNTSLTLTPGLSVSLPLSTSFGVVSPYVRGEYVHEFGDQADNIRGNLNLISDASFKLTPNNTVHDYGNVGAGVTTTLGKGISAFVDYNILVGFSDLVVQTATIGGRYEF